MVKAYLVTGLFGRRVLCWTRLPAERDMAPHSRRIHTPKLRSSLGNPKDPSFPLCFGNSPLSGFFRRRYKLDASKQASAAPIMVHARICCAFADVPISTSAGRSGPFANPAESSSPCPFESTECAGDPADKFFLVMVTISLTPVASKAAIITCRYPLSSVCFASGDGTTRKTIGVIKHGRPSPLVRILSCYRLWFGWYCSVCCASSQRPVCLLKAVGCMASPGSGEFLPRSRTGSVVDDDLETDQADVLRELQFLHT